MTAPRSNRNEEGSPEPREVPWFETRSDACRQIAFRRAKDGPKTRRTVDLHEGDVFAFLRPLPDECIGQVVTDPPYRARVGGRLRIPFPFLPDVAWPLFFSEIFRVLKPNTHACVFANDIYNDLFRDLARDTGFKVPKSLIYDKVGLGLGGDVRDQNEYVVHLVKGRRQGNLRDFGTILRHRRMRGGYPTEKPVPVLRRLIEHWSDPGDLILDPFCGSGSTGEAARELRRRALLNDIDVSFAADRLRLAPVTR